ncbi:hypothetical protein QBC34DRAFT_428196 [Podospora aff. communis PSN243]|uniref:Uncharacterized protein n=1 Tax=Podospora aff. communis PSN243 TaxID=3040156 RepID=A0AAV9GD60_9PEZI|nr:hypothetical protein QBC34DRAFT_428196 [Podospora aff. communis PSN243]
MCPFSVLLRHLTPLSRASCKSQARTTVADFTSGPSGGYSWMAESSLLLGTVLLVNTFFHLHHTARADGLPFVEQLSPSRWPTVFFNKSKLGISPLAAMQNIKKEIVPQCAASNDKRVMKVRNKIRDKRRIPMDDFLDLLDCYQDFTHMPRQFRDDLFAWMAEFRDEVVGWRPGMLRRSELPHFFNNQAKNIPDFSGHVEVARFLLRAGEGAVFGQHGAAPAVESGDVLEPIIITDDSDNDYYTGPNPPKRRRTEQQTTHPSHLPSPQASPAAVLSPSVDAWSGLSHVPRRDSSPRVDDPASATTEPRLSLSLAPFHIPGHYKFRRSSRSDTIPILPGASEPVQPNPRAE